MGVALLLLIVAIACCARYDLEGFMTLKSPAHTRPTRPTCERNRR